jgi:hypothetical protein
MRDMTNEPENQKAPNALAEGSFLSILVFPWPWPPTARQIWVQHGVLTIAAEPEGCLTAEVASDGQVFKFTSCRLIVTHEQTTTNIGLSWKLPGIMNMIIGKTIGKTIVISSESASLVPLEATITSGIPNDLRDFSKENAAKVQERHDAWARSHPKSGRRRAGEDEAFEALRQEHQQIGALLKLIDEGNIHHVPGLLARLRMVIAQEQPMPLLQLCAAMIDESLIIFVPPISSSKDPRQGVDLESLVYAISPVATGMTKNAADLDLWLDSRAAQYNGKIHSQREVINHLGNTAGAHFDIDVHPTVDMLRSWKSGINDATLDYLILYVCTVARVTEELIGHVLARKGA